MTVGKSGVIAAGGGGGSDPASTALAYWEFDEVAGSTSFADSSPYSRTATGAGTGQTATGGYEGNCLICDDSPVGYATAPSSTDFDFGSGDFEVGCKVKVLASTGDTQSIVTRDALGSRSWSLNVMQVTGGNVTTLRFSYYASSIRFINLHVSIPFDTWFDLKAGRDGDIIFFECNGTRGTAAAIGVSLPVSTAAIGLGYNHYTGYPLYLNGKLDNVYITEVLT